MALNRIILQGRLTRDPELRKTPGGNSVSGFTLAVDRNKKNDAGERETDFVEIVVWGNTADFVCKYFAKGQMAVVEGRLQVRDWKDKEGNKRRTAEVVADNVYFAGAKVENAAGGYRGSESAGFREIPADDGDLPF